MQAPLTNRNKLSYQKVTVEMKFNARLAKFSVHLIRGLNLNQESASKPLILAVVVDAQEERLATSP